MPLHLRRLIGSALLLALVCALSADVICALPCAIDQRTSPATQAAATEQDHCHDPAAPLPASVWLTSGADSCSEHPSLDAAAELAARRGLLRAASVSIGVLPAEAHASIIARTSSFISPPGGPAAALLLPLRI